MKRVMLLILILCIGQALFISIFHGALCQGSTQIGVKAGDWVRYSVNASEVTGWQDAEWIKVEVEKIFNTSYTVKMLVHWKNGTENTRTETGSFNETGFITFANLSIGNYIEGIPPLPDMKVSSIVTKNYFGVNREVVVFNYTEEGKTAVLYYDRATGFLLEEYYSLPYWGVEYSMSLSPTTTNLWQQQTGLDWQSIRKFFENYISIIIAVVVVCVVLVLIRRRKSIKP
jgi:hypothetical protein